MAALMRIVTLTWWSRLFAKMPMATPALAMFGACCAMQYSPWWWLLCAAGVAAACLNRTILLPVSAAALAAWAGIYLHNYRVEYDVTVATAARMVDMTGTVEGVSGNAVLFRPEHGRWLYLATVKDAENSPLQPGKRYRIQGEFAPLRSSAGPGLFDRKAWGYYRGIVGAVTVTQSQCEGEGTWGSRLMALSARLRHHAAAMLRRGAAPDDEARQVVVSCVLGDKSEAQAETLNRFLQSGSMHVFAVSGMHVGIVCLILLQLFRWLRVPPDTSRILCILFLAGYVFITGMPVSAVRAWVMAALLLTAFVWRRQNFAFNTLGTAFVVLCVWDPMQVFMPGFQLSFGVFAVIACLTAWLTNERPMWAPDPFIPRRIYTNAEKIAIRFEFSCRGLIVISVGAWLASIPLSMYHFGMWNLYAPFTNCLLGVLVFPLMFTALLGLLFGWIPGVLLCCNTVAAWFAGGMLAVTGTIAPLPGSYLPASPPNTATEALIVPTQRNRFMAVIGNPAVLLGDCTQGAAQFTLHPVLKACNVRPQLWLAWHDNKQTQQGVQAMDALYPALDYRLTRSEGGRWQLAPGNTLTQLPSVTAWRTGVRQDSTPIFVWQCHGHNVLIAGDAPFGALMRVRDTIKAQVVVLGTHPRDPIDSVAWLEQCGAHTVICTTNAPLAVPPGVTLYHISRTGVIRLIATEDGITVKPWLPAKTHTE